MHALHAAVIRW